MAIDKFLLEILVCPEDKTPVALIDGDKVKAINQKISSGAVTNRGGKPVKESIDGGLLRADGKYLYPIRKDIPIMLIEEAIPADLFGVR
jgi:uncharacterized protein YbaR (Trm112 family)